MTTFLFCLLASLSTSANAADLRDLRGAPVTVDQATELVTFSMHSPDTPTLLAEVQRRQVAGESVVAVNTDPVQDRSALLPYLRVRSLDLQVAVAPQSANAARVVATSR